MKIYRWFVFTIALFIAVVPALAQERWFVYLFDSINNELVRVHYTGEMEVFSLGIAPGSYLSTSEMAISPDGSRVAYCMMIGGEGVIQGRSLVMRDIASNTNLFEIPVDSAYTGCRVAAFSDDGTRLVLGLAAEPSFDQQSGQLVETVTPGWRMQILDMATGDVLDDLNSQSPNAPVFEGYWHDGFVPLMPIVIEFSGPNLTFAGIPYVGSEGPFELPVWTWDTNTNSVTPHENLWNIMGDYLPETGEVVTAVLDDSRSAAQPGGIGPQANVVNVQMSDGSIRTIYVNEQEVITGTRFVNNGQAVAVSLLEGFDTNNPMDTFEMRHVLVDRSGTVTDIGERYEQYSEIADVPRGIAILWMTNTNLSEGAPISHLSVVENGVSREIWQYQPQMEGGYSALQLVWATPTPIPGGLPPFAAAK
ncbi:MAG: hypothetical protein L0154_09725 [Chloroflexi bacterium]|nr:hypothetical protein [Chloroflexota bacterium]